MGTAVITQELVANSRLEYVCAGKLQKMLALSDGLSSDAAFARQLRRRFLS